MHYEAKYSGFIRIQLLLQFDLEYGRNSLCNIMLIYIYVPSDFYFVCSYNHLRLIYANISIHCVRCLFCRTLATFRPENYN